MFDLNNQKEFYKSGITRSFEFRREQLRKLSALLSEHETELLSALETDFSKSHFEGFITEIGVLQYEIKHTLKHLKQWMRPKKVGTNLINFPASSYILPEPLGSTLIIGAWNYPYLLSLGPVIGAMAAGNTIVLKPSELASNCSKTLKKRIGSFFDPAYFSVVEGDAEQVQKLLVLPFDKIFFTGSTRVGKIIYQAAAKNLTPVTLELGGKSPAIVSAHCNLSMTVKRLVWAKFLNAGQTCIAPDYVMVHHSMYSKFVDACKREIEKADYTISNGNYCQIINTSHFDRLSTYIKEGTLLYGGQMNENERMIGPTLLELNSWEATFMQDEIFGPILPIGTYDSLPKVLQQIKEYPKPLSAYLFSENKKEHKIFLKDFQFGGGAINDAVMHITNPNLPFGGVGTSGMGNYHGKAGFDCFSHHKSILRKPTWMELPLKYAPLKPIKLSLIRKLLKL